MRTIKFLILNILFFYFYFFTFICKFYFLEILFVKFLIKLKNKKIHILKKIIKKNQDNVKFAKYLEIVKRIEILGDDYNDSRIDFGINNYDILINYIKNLIQKFPKEAILYDRLARGYIAKGSKIDAMKNFNYSLKIQRQNLNDENKTGLIVLISMPRSGTGFISNSLLNGLHLKDLRSEYRFSDSWFPNKALFPFHKHLNSPHFIPMKSGFVSGHAPATFENLSFLDHLSDKIVVNFRDPRQSLISWVHYMQYLQYTGNYSALFEYKIGEEYFNKSFEYQIDWQINNYFLETNVNWIEKWIEVGNTNDFNCEILYLNYELLVDNMQEYFSKILDFFNLDKSKFKFPIKPKFQNKTHIRKGDKNEWKKVLSNKQILKINNTIPESWFGKYKWDNNV